MHRNWGVPRTPDAPRVLEREASPWLLAVLRLARRVDRVPPWLLIGTGWLAWCGGLAWAGWRLGGSQ